MSEERWRELNPGLFRRRLTYTGGGRYDCDRISLDQAVAVGDVAKVRQLLQSGVRPGSPFVDSFGPVWTLADYTTGASGPAHRRPHLHEVRCGCSDEMPTRELWTLLAAADAKFIERHRVEQGAQWVACAANIVATGENPKGWPSPVVLPFELLWRPDDESAFADWAEVQSAVRRFVSDAPVGEEPPPLQAEPLNDLGEPVEVHFPAEMVRRILEPSASLLNWRQIHRVSLVCRAFRAAAVSVARAVPAETFSFSHTIDDVCVGCDRQGAYDVSVHAHFLAEELPAAVGLAMLGRFLPNRARDARLARERNELSFSTRTSELAASARAEAFFLSPPILADGRRGLLTSLCDTLVTAETSDQEASLAPMAAPSLHGGGVERDVGSVAPELVEWVLAMERTKENVVHWLLAHEFRAVAWTWSGEGGYPWDNGTEMGAVDATRQETLVFALRPGHERGIAVARLDVGESRSAPESDQSDLDEFYWP